MIRQASVRILTNALLLLLLASVLIFLQFRNRALTFHLGDFSVILYEIIQNKQTILSHAKLEGRSFEMNFGDSATQLKEGIFEKPLALVDYSAGRDTFTLFFEDDISVSFFLDQDKFLIISTNNLPSEAAAIHTPLSLSPRASWSPLEDAPHLAQLNYQKQSLEVALNNSSSFEALKRNRLFLSGEPIKIGPFPSTAVAEPPLIPVATPVAPVEQAPSLTNFDFGAISETDLIAEQNTFRDKAYAGLTNRYNRSSSTWERGATSAFNEKALLATLAEALVRNTYLTQSSLMNQAQIRHFGAITVNASLYLGDIVDSHIATRESKQQQFASLFRDSALAFTTVEGMAQDLFLFGAPSEFDRILALWESTNPLEQNWSLTQISHFLLNHAQTRQLRRLPVADSLLNQVEDLFNAHGTLENGRFQLQEEGQESPEAALKIAAAVLTLTDKSVPFAKLNDMARTLLVHTLRTANEKGTFTAGGSTTYPEDVYAHVSGSRYLPKVFILSTTDRSWALFASDILSSSVIEKTYSFQLNFFTEMPEHVILSRIPFPKSVNFRGITWRTDPQFQVYTDGWSYLTRTQSLYLKISHLLGSGIDLMVDAGSVE